MNARLRLAGLFALTMFGGYLYGTVQAVPGSVCVTDCVTRCATYTPAPVATARPTQDYCAMFPWLNRCRVTATMPVATLAPEHTAQPATQFGVQIIGGPSPAERAAVDGLRPQWIRARVFWTRDMTGWAWSDDVVSYAELAGSRLILEWWMGDECFRGYTREEIVAHAADMAARYAGRVDAYQIGNEPDINGCGKLANAEVYAAVREVIEATGATVLPAGVVDPAWIPLSAPVSAIHAYPEVGDPAAAIAAARWPVWVTETGASGADPETVRRGMRACADAGVPVCIVYRAADDEDVRGFGLYDVLGREKPAAQVYRDEVRR